MIPLRDVIPSRTTPFVTVLIIALNALVFLYEISLPPRAQLAFIQHFGVVPASFQLGSLVTSMFLHGGWLHFLGNMLYLWIFGDNVEDRVGHGRYLTFYLMCGSPPRSSRPRRTPRRSCRWSGQAARLPA